MTWTTPKEIRERLVRRWRTGVFLRYEGFLRLECEPSPTPRFPLRVGVRGPSAAEMVDRFADVQRWAGRYLDVASNSGFAVEWRSQKHRLLGQNRVPAGVVFDDIDGLAAFLGSSFRRELSEYRECLGLLGAELPEILSWASERPFDLLAVRDDLPRLIAVPKWIREHPRPEIYLRQLPVPGVDTKFLERYRTVLGAWLDIILPAEYVRQDLRGKKNFEARFGFRARPELVRFRILDPALRIEGFSDLTVPADEFAEWEPTDLPRVFVLENDVTGLAFPDADGSIVVFGRGYSFSGLERAKWLSRVDLVYWGDLDTHGFAILDQFRGIFPHARSMLMDMGTLRAHEAQWGVESKQTTAELSRLTSQEADVYDALRFNTIRDGLRLEQELVSFPFLERALSRV